VKVARQGVTGAEIADHREDRASTTVVRGPRKVRVPERGRALAKGRDRAQDREQDLEIAFRADLVRKALARDPVHDPRARATGFPVDPVLKAVVLVRPADQADRGTAEVGRGVPTAPMIGDATIEIGADLGGAVGMSPWS
jgi:hypothetical protein